MNDDQTTNAVVADPPVMTGEEVVDTAKEVLSQEPAMSMDAPVADAPTPMDPPAEDPSPMPVEAPVPEEAPAPEMPAPEAPVVIPENPVEAPAPTDTPPAV